MYFQREVIIIFCISLTRGEQWYSATIIDDNQSGMNSNQYKNYLQYQDKNVPLTTILENKIDDTKTTTPKQARLDTESNYSWSDRRLERLQILKPSKYETVIMGNLSDAVTKINTDTKIPMSRQFGHNNTASMNTMKRVEPRRIIRKRCPGLKEKKSHMPKTRFLEVFEVVQFEHVICTSSSGLDGRCLHEYECQTSGGFPMGTCADGYGTCCVNQFSCDDIINVASGWFTNPGYPSPSSERLSCSVTLNKASEDVKQIRLDFVIFELLPPTDGTCEQDQFVVSGQNVNNVIPILCGINTGQHVYIEVSDITGPLYLSIQTVSPENRMFSIKVTQLTWADELAAPTGCLQYFKEPQGYLQSFNFIDKSDIGIARSPSYFNNLNYAMCIERAAESCSITYTNTGDMEIVNYDANGIPLIPPEQAGVEIFNCPTDWLLIAATRLCGSRLNDGSVTQDFAYDAPVTDIAAGPIVVWFRSDGGYIGKGFKLQYQQNACIGTDR